jgi:nicotinate-nucleotide adenylyltransferase
MKSTNCKKEMIGIFGGTFDPIHKGHLAIAEQARKQLHLNAVYFVPAYIPPHKTQYLFTTANQRLTMVKSAIEDKKYLKCSDIELRRRGISYTVDTLKAFKRRFAHAQLFLIIGSDNYEQFHSWKNPKTILQLASLAVYKRHGSVRSMKNLSIPFEPIQGNYLRVSSTDIRNRILRGLSVQSLVPQPIGSYINHHSLYIKSNPHAKSKIHCAQ